MCLSGIFLYIQYTLFFHFPPVSLIVFVRNMHIIKSLHVVFLLFQLPSSKIQKHKVVFRGVTGVLPLKPFGSGGDKF